MKKLNLLFTVLAIAILFNSCKKDKQEDFDISNYYGTYSYTYGSTNSTFPPIASQWDITISGSSSDNEIIINTYNFELFCVSSTFFPQIRCSVNGNKLSISDSGFSSSQQITGTGEYNLDTDVLVLNLDFENNGNNPCQTSIKYALTKK